MEPDERQASVIEALQGRSIKLAGIYRTALVALSTSAAPGCELARASVICHCARELMNGVPTAMSEVDIARPQPSSGTLTKALPGLLSEINLVVNDSELVRVPSAAAQALDRLVKTVVQEQGRNLRLASAFITDGSDDSHPAIKQWKDAYGFFMKWTHLDRLQEDREPPRDEDILSNLRIVEDLIQTRAGRFFANLHAIEDLLALANETTNEDAR